jgi:hypothetical protein
MHIDKRRKAITGTGCKDKSAVMDLVQHCGFDGKAGVSKNELKRK